MNGGEPRELIHANSNEGLDGFRLVWTPDNTGVLVGKTLGRTQELWLVPVSGASPRKFDVDVNNWVLPGGAYSLDPAGHRIAFVASAGAVGAEVWALENFLPKPNEK
jgi:hypothetical protein